MPFKSIAYFVLTIISLIATAQIDLIVPIGHSRRVTDVQQSANKDWIASADGSNKVTIWNYHTQSETYHISGDSPVKSISYAPSQPVLYIAFQSGMVLATDEKAQTIRSFKAGENPLAIYALSGDSVLVVGNKTIALWNKGQQVKQVASKLDQITSSHLLGQSLFIGGPKGSIETIDVTTFKINEKINVSEAEILTISSTSKELIIGTQTGELILMDLASHTVKQINPFSLRTYDVTYLPFANAIMACGRDSKQNLKAFTTDLSSQELPFSWTENLSDPAFGFGLRVLTTNTDSTLLLADYQNRIKEYDFKNQQWSKVFEGEAASIYDMAVDRTGTKLAIASNHDVIKVIDLTGTTADQVLAGSEKGSRAVSFHPVNPVLATYGLDEQIRVTNLISQKELFSLQAKGEYSTTPVTFDPTGRYVLRKSSEEDFDFYNFTTSKPKNLKVKSGKDYIFSPNGRQLIFHTNKGLVSFDPITFEKLKEIELSNIQHIAISSKGDLAILLKDDVTVQIRSAESLKLNSTIALESPSDELYWTPDSESLIGIRNSVKRGEPDMDFTIKHYAAATGKLKKTFSGHSGFVFDVEFVNSKMLTASIDGVIKIWALDEKSNAPIGLLIPFNNDQYVVTTPAGLFDATPEAMKLLHYVKNGELINLEQIKESYYEPKLLSKLLELNLEPIRSSKDLANVKLHPELSLKHPLKNNGKLGINLDNKGGGIGRVLILINGKEVSSDVRNAANDTPDASSLEIDYDITDHPFLYNDRVNKITIKAYNTDGTLSSDEKSLYVFGEEKSLEAPSLYAVIAGSSDYEGESLDLKFAAKDATDLANALQLSASKYLGAEKTNITLLTTDQEESKWPTKENIQKAFADYKTKAKANDILFVYLSGHGVNHSGDMSDFYYLTCAANSGDMNNTLLREEAAISSREFTEYIKAVPALKQILIIDACHSGRLASSLASSRSAMSSTQIRALERMKDRTGLFVLAGSAADAVSYETTLYGQGLLTYSLLFGMKGAALRDNEFVDVLDLFQFAANKVPELAEEIGGIQKPEIRVPEDGKSFDIGRLSTSDRDAIILAAPRPVYVHSRFQDESAIFDRLGLSELVDQQLLELSKQDEAPIAFVDDKSFSGATLINGRYSETNGLIKATITFVKNGAVSKKVELEAVNAAVLSEAILKHLGTD